MLDFNAENEYTVKLEAGTVTMTNKSKHDKTVEIYVPNRYDAFTKIPSGGKIVVNTASSGETFMYLAQADKDLEVVVTAGDKEQVIATVNTDSDPV